MKVRRPGPGDAAGAAARIREASEGYTTSEAALNAETEKMVEQFRERLAEIRSGKASAVPWKKRRRRRGQTGLGRPAGRGPTKVNEA